MLELFIEPCEWVDADLGVLWIKSEQKLHLKFVCLNFNPVRGSASYPRPYVLGRPFQGGRQILYY